MTSTLSRALGGVKGTVIVALTHETSLSAKGVYRRIVKSGVGVTYQGVFKALKELLEQEIILRDEAGYSINRVWLSSLAQEITSIQSSLDGKTFSVLPENRGRLSSAFRAISLLKHLLLSGHLTFSKDELYLFTHRVAMVSMRHYLTIYLKLRKYDPRFLYSSARELGRYWFGEMRARGLSKGSIEQEMQFGADALSIAGWGGINVEYVDVEKQFVRVTMDYSPFARQLVELRKKSAYPVDDMVGGCLAGGFSVILGNSKLHAKEINCIAKGDARCVFEISDGVSRG